MGSKCNCLTKNDNESSVNIFTDIYQSESIKNKLEKNVKSNIQKGDFVKNSFTLSQITYIQEKIRGFLYKKKFNKEKSLLNQERDKSILNLQERFSKILVDNVKFDKNKKEKIENFNFSQFENDFLKRFPFVLSLESRNRIENILLSNINNNKDLILVHSVLFDEYDNSLYIGNTDIQLNKTGYGIQYFNNNEAYEGNWKENVMFGYGKYYKKNNDIYEGIFDGPSISSFGKIINLNTDYSYIGEMKNSQKEGVGVEMVSTGNKPYIFKGEFSKNQKNGKGKIMYTQLNEEYEGEFVNDKITGRGEYIWSYNDKNNKYIGEFCNGNMHGHGEYTWPEGSKYIGEYVNNLKEGVGIYYWSNGNIYEGQFKNGKKHGNGVMKIREKRYLVEFDNGNLVKQNKIKEEKDLYK